MMSVYFYAQIPFARDSNNSLAGHQFRLRLVRSFKYARFVQGVTAEGKDLSMHLRRIAKSRFLRGVLAPLAALLAPPYRRVAGDISAAWSQRSRPT